MNRLLKDFYRKIRPGEPATLSNARSAMMRLFFDPKRYNLGRVGRYKLNSQTWYSHSMMNSLQTVTLTKEDVIGALKYLIRLKQGDENAHDRRYRPLGQSPCAICWRIDPKPVPHRLGPHGENHPRKNEPVRFLFRHVDSRQNCLCKRAFRSS